MTPWSLEYEGTRFARFFLSLPEYEQVVLSAALRNVLEVEGIGVCSGEWGKPLGHGLYEFRVRKSLDAIPALDAAESPPAGVGTDRPVLLRIFCTFYGSKIVLLYSGYDKKRDSSAKRPQKEISQARKIHQQWKLTGRH
jgi:hypothetical protein